MKQSRFENLADGIFAIVMTLMVLELKVPLTRIGSEANFIGILENVFPFFMSYLLSFALLYTYWQTHHFIMSIYAKNIDVRLSNINAFFLFLIGLVPFSSQFLGTYSTYHIPVILFSLHMIFIGLTLFYMRVYITKSETIKNTPVTEKEHMHANVHILFPVIAAFIALFISFWDIPLSLLLLTLAVLFNFFYKSTRITYRLALSRRLERKSE